MSSHKILSTDSHYKVITGSEHTINNEDLMNVHPSENNSLSEKDQNLKLSIKRKSMKNHNIEAIDFDPGHINMINSFRSLDLDDLIQKVGSESVYFKLMMMQFALLVTVMAGISYLTSFLLADPDFTCYDPSGNKTSCSEADFCKKYWPDKYNKNQINWKYTSWVEQNKLICDSGSYRDTYKNTIMIVSAISAYLTITMSDNFGRVRTY